MAKYGWYQSSPKAQKPSDALKQQVEAAMKPILEAATAKLPPFDESKQVNQGMYFFGKWYRNFYYVYEKLKTPPNAMVEEFDYGVARMKYVGNGKFDLAYFRYTEKWEDLPMHSGLSLQEAAEAIESDPWFLSNYL
ncbi:MAG: hypothetical protein AAF847_10700 [Bacteroidota bacterium]